MKNIRNYSLIVALLQKKKEVTLREIAAHLEANDVSVSQRTIERYIQELRDDYGIVSDCDRRTNRYSFNEENAALLSSLFHLFHLVQSSELLAESIKNKEKALDCLLFEAGATDAGSVNLEPIYTAIMQSKSISFDHESFEREQISRYSIQPYLLKEYNAKWYMVGVFAHSNAIRIFGLDRMTHIQISDETFEKTERTRILSLFEFLIGLVYDIEKPTTVDLLVTPMQAKYFKKTPLHATQSIISESEEGVVFRYYLIPNRELQRLILGYGSQIKVLKPEWFVKQLREQMEATMALYKS
jgi:predicted DNA-binding transcriptional regulator YafY